MSESIDQLQDPALVSKYLLTNSETLAAEQAGTDFQALWSPLRQRPWRTLALVPAQESLSLFRLAHRLARAGELAERTAVDVVRADRHGPHGLSQLTARLRAGSPHALQLVVLGALGSRPLGAQLARAADCALIVLSLGESRLDEVRRTADRIGRERILGCLALRSE